MKTKLTVNRSYITLRVEQADKTAVNLGYNQGGPKFSATLREGVDVAMLRRAADFFFAYLDKAEGSYQSILEALKSKAEAASSIEDLMKELA